MATSPREPSLATGAAVVLVLSTLVTIVMAWPVVRSPGTMILGREIVGRHHDPFTVMQQFAAGGARGPYQQPLTDQAGVGLAHVFGAIPAYNLLILFSFPLAALAAYGLGRYLWRSHVAAVVAALAFAFAPVHVAHATYHVHIAQTHWIPLYLLALFAAIDRPTLGRVLLLLASGVAMVLSNYYAGLIGAMVTPVAIPAYWFARRPATTLRALLLPASALGLAAFAGVLVIRWAFPDLVDHPEWFAFPPEDVGRYGARWWAYFVPPVYHAWLGGVGREALRQADLVSATVELQLSLTWTLTAFALAAVAVTLRRRALTPAERAVLAVAGIGAWAFVASLSPSSAGCTPDSFQPACLGYRVAPMFRGYARVGIMTSLCVSLLAGYAVARLTSAPRWRNMGRGVPAGALAMAAFELWPFPGARDVLPTRAHRVLAERAGQARVLDCVALTAADASLVWLMEKEVRLLTKPFDRCDDSDLVPKLAALGFTDLIVRASVPPPWADGAPPSGLELAEAFPDARLYRVAATAPPLVVLDMTGFRDWESEGATRRRLMELDGEWTIFNTTSHSLRAALDVELEAVDAPRSLVIEIDGQPVTTLDVAPSRRTFTVGPVDLAAGSHHVQFVGVGHGESRVKGGSGGAQDTLEGVRFYRWEWRAQPELPPRGRP